MIKDKILKAADIAKLCGISEEEVKRITGEFSKAVPSRDFGRIKVYEEKAAGVISTISDLRQKGLSKEEIFSSIGCVMPKKSTREKVMEKSGDSHMSQAGREKPVSAVTVIESAEKAVSRAISNTASSINRESDKYGALEVRISKLTARLEKVEKDASEQKEDSDKKYNELKEMILALDEKISVSKEWVDYFEKSLDSYKDSQDKISANLLEWTEYTERELDELKKPFWKKIKGKKEIDTGDNAIND